MDKITVAFIGIGGYGSVTLRDVLASERDDFAIVACADPFAQGCAHYDYFLSHGIPVFDSVEALYDGLYDAGKGVPDLCVISTPIAFHTHQICYCLSHGSNVLCEKPLTGDADDLPMLAEADRVCGGFVAVGYQWSYSEAIGKLKADILRGVYGRPLSMKSIVLWPRNKAYFTRSTGWAGRVCDAGGKKILDSVVNNATAHYIHNILYLLGKTVDEAAQVRDMQATLLRTNAIETFDTATVRFTLEDGTKCFYAASHAAKDKREPEFVYTFENGVVTYATEKGEIVGTLKDGTTLRYGDPYAAQFRKFFTCLDYIRDGIRKNVACGVKAATPQVKFVAKLHAENKIFDTLPSAIKEHDGFLYVEGLNAALDACYDVETLLSEQAIFDKIAAGGAK